MAGASFPSSVVFTLALWRITIRAKVPAEVKGQTFRYVKLLKPERFRQRIIFLVSKTAIPPRSESSFIIWPFASRSGRRWSILGHPLRIAETRSAFICSHNVVLAVIAVCASAIQIVRLWVSTPDTQRQLHPALLRLSAMISPSFNLLGVIYPMELCTTCRLCRFRHGQLESVRDTARRV